MTEANTPLDRQASALANIQEMHDNYREALEQIAQYRADIEQWKNRVDVLLEDRNHYRAKWQWADGKLTEVCTSMADIGLLTMRAVELMKMVREDEDKQQQGKGDGHGKQGNGSSTTDPAAHGVPQS